MTEFKTRDDALKHLDEFFQSGKYNFTAGEIAEKEAFIQACKFLYLDKNGITNEKVDLEIKPVLVNGDKIPSVSASYSDYRNNSEESQNGKFGKILFDENNIKNKSISAYRLMFLTFHELQHCVQSHKPKTYDTMYDYYNTNVGIGNPSETAKVLQNPKVREKCSNNKNSKYFYNKIFDIAWCASPNEINADYSALDFISEYTQEKDIPKQFSREFFKHKHFTKVRHSVAQSIMPAIESSCGKFNKKLQDKKNTKNKNQQESSEMEMQ